MNREDQLNNLVDFMKKIATDWEDKKDESVLRKHINDLMIMERNIPYDEIEVTRYFSGEKGYKALFKEVSYSDENSFFASMNTILPNRGQMSNKPIQDFTFDLTFNECKINVKKHKKLHVELVQHMKPTKRGKAPKDADNNEKKGVIDGISSALNIDDTGDRISYSSDIELLSDAHEEPYTEINIYPHDKYRKTMKKLKSDLQTKPYDEI